MHGYQTANNSDKMMDMGRKVLKIDPDDPEALVGVARSWRSARGRPIWTRITPGRRHEIGAARGGDD